ncbi:lipopolysaccharide biosynthesis protein [Lacrimispora sp.]|uniref:lipopolysaccharide biosynthesis protein n=1 Tax=Lacrimispora sp. TaxID=2719234 RepID=UPI0034614C0F
MEKKNRILFKNVIYTFLSNFTSFIINALVVLIVPKVIGVSDYGYYQLYVLLATYALYFHFGWCDGIYLRHVGEDYNKLDKEILSSQFKGICILSAILFVIFLLISLFTFSDPNKLWVYSFAVTAVLIVTPKTYTSVVLQAANRMKQYSQLVLIEKIIYVVILVLMIIIGIRDFEILILSDIIGKIAALLLGMFFCKEIIYTKIEKGRLKEYFYETLENIKVGSFLLLSNLASILITGIIQFAVEVKWSIETFGKVSLTFNMSKMLLVVITAMSIVLVPILKHLNKKQLAYMYTGIRSILMFILGAMLLFYYPLKSILAIWLPQYSESLQYMALLFPMCLFESKTSLLINTYMKAMREEKKLCAANVFTVMISALAAAVTVFWLENINLAILTIPCLLALRCIILEYYIEKVFDIHLMKDAIIEIGLATCFIVSSWYIDSWKSMIPYLIVYVSYVLYIRKDLIKTLKKILGSTFN